MTDQDENNEPRDFAGMTAFEMYQALRQQYPTRIILLHAGDFVEAYEDHAQTLHDLIGEAAPWLYLDHDDRGLGYRNVGKGYSVLSFIISFEDLHSAVELLIQSGHDVSVAEPQGDPRFTVTQFREQFIRLTTPGRLISKN